MKLRYALLGAIAASLLTGALVAQGQVPGVNSTLASVFTLAYDNSTMMPTYSATTIVTPVAHASQVCTLSGSASKTVKVRRVILSGQSDAQMSDIVTITKSSTAYTAGNGTAITKIPYDASSIASSVVMAENWAGNPTAGGTLVGVLSEEYLPFANQTTGSGTTLTFTFGALGQPIVLRGAAQSISVDLGSLTYSSNTRISCTFEWTEQ